MPSYESTTAFPSQMRSAQLQPAWAEVAPYNSSWSLKHTLHVSIPLGIAAVRLTPNTSEYFTAASLSIGFYPCLSIDWRPVMVPSASSPTL